MGTNVRDWFVNVLAAGATGNADLVAYFFLRAQALLAARGTLGLIATNTIAQGDTREVGLDQHGRVGIHHHPGDPEPAVASRSANLEYAAVWGTLGAGRPMTCRALATACRSSESPRSSNLAGESQGNPIRLAENAGIAFKGAYVLGMGFVLEPEKREHGSPRTRAIAMCCFRT